MSVTLSVEGKVAVITGGSRGIGAACVRMFSEAGARIVFNYQSAKDAAAKLALECGSDRCLPVQAELDGMGGEKMLIEAGISRFGAVDILVVNHGIWPHNDVSIDSMTEEQWHRTVAINLDSVYLLVKHAVAAMKKEQQGGHIVLVSSTAGQRGEAFHTDYAATKGAVISMVKGLAAELAPDGIYVNAVAPGWVRTDMSEPALSDEKTRSRALSLIPLRRVAAPEEIAAPILFLCTPHAGFITGEIFNVNGGAVLVG
ncbi:MAG: SDR family NAD(P)-dependent oxidoreductase [Acidobacteriaceae bacterium]